MKNEKRENMPYLYLNNKIIIINIIFLKFLKFLENLEGVRPGEASQAWADWPGLEEKATTCNANGL